jgi:hypothetical protein
VNLAGHKNKDPFKNIALAKKERLGVGSWVSQPGVGKCF